MVSSPSLDETLDVEKLIPGSLSAIRNTALALADAGSDFSAIAGMLNQVEVVGWKGAAADEFRKKWHDLPESWAAAAKTYRNAHRALVDYQTAFATARSAAEDAVTLYGRGQELTNNALVHFHADQEARAAQQAGKPYVPGPKSVALGQGFHDPGEAFRREAQQNLDDVRTRLHRSAHAASLTILDGVALAPKAPPTGWDQFWGGVNEVVEFPGNVVEGFLLAGWDTVSSIWSTSPAKWILELVFSGPDVTWKDLMTQGEAGAAAVLAISKDPIGSLGKLLGDVFDVKEWGSNPGHVVGNAILLVASFAVPGGAVVKAAKVGEDAEKALVDGSKIADAPGVIGPELVRVPGTDKLISKQLYDATYQASVHNVDASTVMLGKFDRDKADGYIERAGGQYTYFSLGADWGNVKVAQGLDDDDMFTLYNERFLKDGVAAHKTFDFSHYPKNDPGYLGREYRYLVNVAKYRFDPVTWQATPPK